MDEEAHTFRDAITQMTPDEKQAALVILKLALKSSRQSSQERPAAGGRAIARTAGAVLLLAGLCLDHREAGQGQVEARQLFLERYQA